MLGCGRSRPSRQRRDRMVDCLYGRDYRSRHFTAARQRKRIAKRACGVTEAASAPPFGLVRRAQQVKRYPSGLGWRHVLSRPVLANVDRHLTAIDAHAAAFIKI